MESAALLEPLSVAIHATRRATIEQGDTVIVFGAGTVGLLTAAMAKVSGATTVVIADIDCGRINYALANGFAHKGYIVTPQNSTPETAGNFDEAKELADDIVQIASLNDPEFEGADVTFDCTGKEVCMQAGLYVSLLKCQKAQMAHMTTGNKAGRTARHGGNGYSDPNTSHVRFSSKRGRHYWHFPLCQYLPYRHQTHLSRRVTKS
jgi:threonine dehydrogenase-like Zn-dependent dehydrogenase